jgi:hypothetical protein
MNGTNPQLPAWLPESLRDDPKKAGILGVLVLVLVVLTLRYLLMGGPTPAQASPGKPATKKTAAKSVVSKVVERTDNESTVAVKRWLDAPVSSVSRNLFSIRQEFYPSRSSKVASTGPESGGFWEEIEKSKSKEVDDKRRRDILVENLQREAAKLRLQSTVMGPEPQAIIGGSLVKEGDVVASDGPGTGVQFRVLSIEARRVIIEREGIKLELRMQK